MLKIHKECGPLASGPHSFEMHASLCGEFYERNQDGFQIPIPGFDFYFESALARFSVFQTVTGVFQTSRHGAVFVNGFHNTHYGIRFDCGHIDDNVIQR
jgi:hypothetical protein